MPDGSKPLEPVVVFRTQDAVENRVLDPWSWIAGALLLINLYAGLCVYGVVDFRWITSVLHKLTRMTVVDQKNFLAGFEATSAILCVLLDYFNPPRRGTPLLHTSKLPKVAA